MGLGRRAFLKFLAGASAGIMVTPLPWKLLDDASIWTQNWSWIPRNQKGAANFVNAVSKTCPSSVAVTVRLADKRPVRVIPDHEHPLGGGVTAIAASEIQMLYSPARVEKPLLRSKDGAYTVITWSAAAQLLHDRLKEAGRNTAFVSGDETGSTTEVISAFAKALGSDKVFMMPSEGQNASVALSQMGITGRIGYDVANSDCVLAIGANIFETFGPAVSFRKAFFTRKPHPEAEADTGPVLIYAGPVQNNTAATATRWLPIKPGSEGALALGIAAELVRKGSVAPASDQSAFNELCRKTTLAVTAEATGLSEEQITAVVSRLTEAKSPLVITGSAANGGEGAAPVIAGFAVNALLGNINKDGGVKILPETPTVVRGAMSRAEIARNDLCAFLSGDSLPAMIVFNEANPVFALPDPAGTTEALGKIPFKVAFTSMMDETASQCDLILPIAMGLERYDDIANPFGFPKTIYCSTQPVKEPGEFVRDTPNLLLITANQMGFALGFDKYQDVIKAKARAMNGNFDLLMQGEPIISSETVRVAGYSLLPALLEASSKPLPSEGLALAITTRLGFGTAQTGIPPFSTKTIRNTELEGREMFVQMNRQTATANGLSANDRVTLATGKRTLTGLVHLNEGIAPGTVAATYGFGHTAFDEFSRNKGHNVMALLTAQSEPQTGLSVWSHTALKVTKA